MTEQWQGDWMHDAETGAIVDGPVMNRYQMFMLIRGLKAANYVGVPEGYWAAAAKFTRERLEQIRQLTYEISLLKLIHTQGDRSEWHPIDHEDDQDALLRSSRRLESLLADLKRGMR